ncbi:hypothetical protein [Paenibacillus wynnii]|uniref:hypothetical protein n=1 Tax=Paenibacillus wynnii TaxID=268407 RepID=UPI0006916C23|nr:hypothetical protein [Paenibacillus wynnii]
MSWTPVLFMIFSTLETFALYFLIMTLFRFKWARHVWEALFIILFLNLQSYLLRNELDMPSFAPLVLVIVFILFFALKVKMPLVLSVIATISGFVIFTLVQTIILLGYFGSISSIDNNASNGYLLQFITSIIIIPVCWLSYVKGKGFTYDYEKLRFKLEDVVLTTLVVLFLPGVSLLFYFKELYLNIVLFMGLSMFLLAYSSRKEKEDD